MSLIAVPVSFGELIDKITILEIKSARISDKAKLENVRTELAYAEVARESGNPAAAVAHFQSAKELLTEEMGEYPRAEFLQVIEPGLQVTAIAEGTAAPRS